MVIGKSSWLALDVRGSEFLSQFSFIAFWCKFSRARTGARATVIKAFVVSNSFRQLHPRLPTPVLNSQISVIWEPLHLNSSVIDVKDVLFLFEHNP
jgi:hypothetical protein